MHIYDISLNIHPDMPVWPGDPPVIFERFEKIEEGSIANVTRISVSAHSGTHVDAPYHFLGDSLATVEKLSLKSLMGRAYVLLIPDSIDLITADLLQRLEIPPRTRRLLFKTRNSANWANQEQIFQPGFVALSEDAAQSLVERGIKLVGVDYLSVAPFEEPIKTHQVLLQAGVIVVEGLDLSAVSPGRYSIYCLPLKLVGADGAPARVILIGV